MTPYILSEEGELDLYLASDRIARRNPTAAIEWEEKLLDTLEHLAEWPLTGRIRPEYAPSPYRVWAMGDYLIIYDPTADPLLVAAILHGARNIAELLAERFAADEPDSE